MSIDLKKIKTIALVGASNNPEKYGHKILMNLAARGFKVFPINPHEDCIAGLKVYKKVSDLPEVPDMVDIVVPANIGIAVIKESIEFSVKNIWVQPGAESEEIIELLNKTPEINFVVNACVMMN